MRRTTSDDLFASPSKKKQQPVPYAFVLDALAPLDPYTRPMFGCTAVYVEDKIVVILRDKPAPAVDNGVWVATTKEHHESLKAELPSLRSISVLGPGITGWQIIPDGLDGFEEEVMRVTRMVLAGDPRIGKVPAAKRPKGPATKKTAAKKTAAKKTTGKSTAAKKESPKKTVAKKTAATTKTAAKKQTTVAKVAKKAATKRTAKPSAAKPAGKKRAK